MKIQPVTPDNLAKACALLKRAFPGRDTEALLVQNLHDRNRTVHDWVCIHTNKAIAYLGFSQAYRETSVCGLHLGPMAVAPEFQRQGIGSELLRFALRQTPIKEHPLYVLGAPGFFQRFGFTPCSQPSSPLARGNARFQALRNPPDSAFVIGYEPEFHGQRAAAGTPGPRHR